MPTDLQNGLVLHLPLNDGKLSTKCRDISKYQNHGTISGAVGVRPYNDMSNTSNEEGEAPIVIYDDDETFWSNIANTTLTEETTIKKKGTSSLKIVVSGGNGSFGHTYGGNQDWSKYDLVTFWWYGNNNSDVINVVVYATDVSNYFTYSFTDNFTGWKRIIIPKLAFTTGAGSPSWSTVLQYRVEGIADGTTTYMDRTTVDVGNWRFGDAMFFDGVNDVINCGLPLTSTDTISWGGWIITNSVSGVQRLFTCESMYELFLNGSSIQIELNNENTLIYGAGLSINQSYFIFVTYDKNATSNRTKLYLNGKLVAVSDVTTTTLVTPDEYFMLGKRASGQPFYGIISNSRMYNRVLSVEEIQALYQEKSIDLKRGLVLNMNINENSGTKIYDKSKHQKHGTLSGGTWGSGELSFDGDEDYIEIPNSDGLDLSAKNHSIGIEVQGESGGDAIGTIFSKHNTGGYILTIDSGNLVFLEEGSSDVSLSYPFTLDDGIYHKVVITVNQVSGISKMYIDGKLVVTDSSISILINEIASLYLGGVTTTNNFKGKLRNFKIYNRELSAEEVRSL